MPKETRLRLRRSQLVQWNGEGAVPFIIVGLHLQLCVNVLETQPHSNAEWRSAQLRRSLPMTTRLSNWTFHFQHVARRGANLLLWWLSMNFAAVASRLFLSLFIHNATLKSSSVYIMAKYLALWFVAIETPSVRYCNPRYMLISIHVKIPTDKWFQSDLDMETGFPGFCVLCNG
jgi:hypothetical protein